MLYTVAILSTGQIAKKSFLKKIAHHYANLTHIAIGEEISDIIYIFVGKPTCVAFLAVSAILGCPVFLELSNSDVLSDTFHQRLEKT